MTLTRMLSGKGAISALLVLLAAVPFSMSFAEESQTTVTPLDDELSLEETVMTLVIPENNTLPWAFIEGKIQNPAPDFPVIIQFFNEESGNDPIHVAQTEVNDDNSYEYQFRVRDVNVQTGQTINIFEGMYTIKVFKVVISQNNLDSA